MPEKLDNWKVRHVPNGVLRTETQNTSKTIYSHKYIKSSEPEKMLRKITKKRTADVNLRMLKWEEIFKTSLLRWTSLSQVRSSRWVQEISESVLSYLSKQVYFSVGIYTALCLLTSNFMFLENSWYVFFWLHGIKRIKLRWNGIK